MAEIDALLDRKKRLLSNGRNSETSGIIKKIERKIRRLEKQK